VFQQAPPPPSPPTIAPPPTGPPLDARTAAADARAAKARAKALRPWYRKKRWWVAISLVTLIAIGAAAQNSTRKGRTVSSTAGGGATSGGSNNVSSGLGTADASADVTDVSVGATNLIGDTPVQVTVVNNSSGRSNYVIDLAAESADGGTQYDTTTAIVDNLDPGQTTTVDAIPFTTALPDGAVVKVKTVQRNAAP
jgi:hypothetical protein